MPRNDASDWDDDWDEGDDAWNGDDADSVTSECPKCGADVYEDAVRCPLCGEYITHGRSAWDGKPVWWKLLGWAGVLAVLGTLMFLW